MRLLLTTFILTITALGCLSSAQTMQFSIKLDKYGWQPDQLKITNGEREIGETRRVAFDSTGKLYVGFAIGGDNRLLKPGEANNTFRVLTIDSASGAVKRKLDFATQSKEWVGLNVSASDDLVVTANNKVQLVGEDGSPKATFDIPMPKGNHLLFVRQSASGKTLLITLLDLNAYYFLREDTLSLITHCYVPPERNRDEPGTFSDNIQLRFVGTQVPGSPYEMVKAPLCGEGQDLWSLGTSIVHPHLLNDSTVLELKTATSDADKPVFEVLKINGELVWKRELPKHFAAPTLLPICTTRDWHRFAVTVMELRGGSRTFDISPRAVSMGVWIYDARTGKQIGSIKYPTLGRYEFALSPDGSKLAILSNNGGTMQLWSLPGN